MEQPPTAKGNRKRAFASGIPEDQSRYSDSAHPTSLSTHATGSTSPHQSRSVIHTHIGAESTEATHFQLARPHEHIHTQSTRNVLTHAYTPNYGASVSFPSPLKRLAVSQTEHHLVNPQINMPLIGPMVQPYGIPVSAENPVQYVYAQNYIPSGFRLQQGPTPPCQMHPHISEGFTSPSKRHAPLTHSIPDSESEDCSSQEDTCCKTQQTISNSHGPIPYQKAMPGEMRAGNHQQSRPTPHLSLSVQPRLEAVGDAQGTGSALPALLQSPYNIDFIIDMQPPSEVRTRTPREIRNFSLVGSLLGKQNYPDTQFLVRIELCYAPNDASPNYELVQGGERILGGTTVVNAQPNGKVVFNNLSICEASIKHHEREFCLGITVLGGNPLIPVHRKFTASFYTFSHKKVLQRRRNLKLRAISSQCGPTEGGVQLHVIGSPFITSTNFAITFTTKYGCVRASKIDMYSDCVAFFDLPECPGAPHAEDSVIPALVRVTNDGRNFSDGLQFSYIAPTSDECTSANLGQTKGSQESTAQGPPPSSNTSQDHQDRPTPLSGNCDELRQQMVRNTQLETIQTSTECVNNPEERTEHN